MPRTRRDVLLLAGTLAAELVVGGCSVHAEGTLTPSDSVATMQAFLAKRGLAASDVTVPQLVESTLEFYRTVRASGLAPDPQADMLLFQCGTFDWGQGEHFEIDLTRQFILAGAGGDDAISQLRFTAYFPSTPELRAIPMANRWCRSIAEVKAFALFVRDSIAYRTVEAIKPSKVALQWSNV